MERLKLEIARKRKLLEETLGTDKKCFRREELEKKREEEYLKKYGPKEDEKSSNSNKTSPDGVEVADNSGPTLPRREVIRRFRERGEPITLFGETELDSFRRLRKLEVLEPEVNRLSEDSENWMKYSMMHCKLRLKKGVMPTKFACQKRNVIATSTSGISRGDCEKIQEIGLINHTLIQTQTLTEQVTDLDMDFTIPITPEIVLSEQDDEDISTLVHDIDEKADKSVQVLLRSKIRSKAVHCWPTSPRSSTSADTSPVNVSAFEVAHLSPEDRELSSLVPDSRDESLVEGELSEMRVDEESESEVAARVESTIKKIEKNPKIFLGLDSENYFVINLLHERTAVAHLPILLLLRKVKLNESFSVLALQFNISVTTAARNFAMALRPVALFLQQLIMWPEKEIILSNLPIPFRAHYSHVQSIIDCLEIEIEKPSNPVHRALTWSEFKKTYTIKYLISSTPDGLINFVSKGFGGQATNALIIEKSGLLEKLPPMAGIMADHGFNHSDNLFATRNCELIRLLSVSADQKFNKSETRESKRIAGIRKHIERVIRRVREYKFLKPHSCIDSHLAAKTDDVVTIVGGLINLQNKLI